MTDTIPLPTEFQPKKLEDFVGPAAIVAQRIINSFKMCGPRGAPASHLFVGPSGSGKTALARFSLSVFEVQKWNVTEIFGADLSKELVKEIAFSMKLSNMLGGYRAYLFDEIDRASHEARGRLLEIVGDAKQPRETVILGTSNLSIEEFDSLDKGDARGRFSSRWQVHEVTGPSAKEIAPLLEIWLPQKDAMNLAAIGATGPKGEKQAVNVRAILKDALSFLQQ